MPKPARTTEEIEAVRQEILTHALELIVQDGLDGLSMRKLGSRLGVAAKTVYNYYRNKDEIYLNIVIQGYRTLYEKCEEQSRNAGEPLDKLQRMSRAYLEFGLDNRNFYNLMLTWQTPKYQDYVGTELEPVAQVELSVSLQLYELFLGPIRELAASIGSIPDAEEQARFYAIYFWSLLHGYLAGYHNTMLSYMVDDPVALKEQLLEAAMRNMKHEVQTWIERG